MPLAARTPPPPPRPAADARRILRALSRQHPNADTELHYSSAFELLVATILSAQCTDERVNAITPELFTRYPDASRLASASDDALQRLIRASGFFRSKARALLGMAGQLMTTHAGKVPTTREALMALPGVGRKTANVVLGHALGVPALPVDRHVLRVANRLGIARSDDPTVVEGQLCASLTKPTWTLASDTFILHGRRICKPTPLCDRCAARADCRFAETSTPPVPRTRRGRKR